MEDTWKLEGYDLIEGSYYPINGSFETEEQAVKEAQKRNDRVSIVRPDGTKYRYLHGR